MKSASPTREAAVVRQNSTGPVWGICVFLALAVLLVFGQTLWNGFVNYDDDLYVYDNPHVAGGLTWQGVSWALTYSQIGHWHPLTWLSHMLDCQFFGLNAGGHHLTNVLLHATTAILLFLLLRRLTDALWPSAFVAAAFAFHPLRVESVAWVAERKDVLSGFFFMLTLLTYVRYVEQSKVHGSKSKMFYGLTLLLFAMGLLSKNMVVTLPFVLLLLDYWPLRRFPFPEQSVTRTVTCLMVEKFPLFILSAASCLATSFVSEKIATIDRLPVSFRLENAAVSYATYLWQMFYPTGLAIPYPLELHNLSSWKVAGAVILLGAISLVAIMRRGKRPYFMVGWFWFIGMLTPAIGAVQISYYAHADRYTYLPQIGLYLAIAWAINDLTASWHQRRIVLGVTMAVTITALMICTSIQISYWRNSESLWTHTLACTTNNFRAHNNLGNALVPQGRLDEAIDQYQQALQINPNYAEAHNNLGNALNMQGRLNEAIDQYQQALQIDPDYTEAHYDFGTVLMRAGRLAEAIGHFERAVELVPDNAGFHYNLGNALLQNGQMEEAAGHFKKALEIQPGFARAFNNLGVALMRLKRMDQAIGNFQKAIGLDPAYAEAHYNLGCALDSENRLAEAAGQYQKAIQLKPDYTDAHSNLADVLVAQGRLDEAVKEYEQTIILLPGSAEVHFRFGQTLQMQKNLTAAKTQYQQAVRLDPDHQGARQQLHMLETP